MVESKIFLNRKSGVPVNIHRIHIMLSNQTGIDKLRDKIKKIIKFVHLIAGILIPPDKIFPDRIKTDHF